MEEILTWGYPGLMLCGFIAGSCIPMSSEAALSAAIALGWPQWPSLFCVFIGNWLGATSNYLIGRFASLDWIEQWVKIKKTKISYMQHFLQGRGVWLSLISFFPTLGNVLVVWLRHLTHALLEGRLADGDRPLLPLPGVDVDHTGRYPGMVQLTFLANNTL
jgi:membrane protein YqaA with SNARE-associated domain